MQGDAREAQVDEAVSDKRGVVFVLGNKLDAKRGQLALQPLDCAGRYLKKRLSGVALEAQAPRAARLDLFHLRAHLRGERQDVVSIGEKGPSGGCRFGAVRALEQLGANFLLQDDAAPGERLLRQVVTSCRLANTAMRDNLGEKPCRLDVHAAPLPFEPDRKRITPARCTKATGTVTFGATTPTTRPSWPSLAAISPATLPEGVVEFRVTFGV